MLREGGPRVRERTLLVLDLSDISKPYAKKMEYLARVRDGSTGGFANGYWLCQVIRLPPALPGHAPGGPASSAPWGIFKRHFWGRLIRY